VKFGITHTVCGVLLHSSPAVTLAGVPLGLAAVKFWTRRAFKGTNGLRGKVNATRIPIEQKESVRRLDNLTRATARLGDPSRCVHVGDREADIYELFRAAHDAGTHFLVRTCVDRLAGRGGTTVSKRMAREPVRGEHEVEVRDDRGRVSTARVSLRFCRMTVHPPVAKQGRYPALSLSDSNKTGPGLTGPVGVARTDLSVIPRRCRRRAGSGPAGGRRGPRGCAGGSGRRSGSCPRSPASPPPGSSPWPSW
jgi:hypothetical protein